MSRGGRRGREGKGGRRAPRGILPVELLQLRVQRWMLALELDRLLEERLSRDREELGLVGCSVFVERRAPILGGVPAQPLVLLREHAAPGAQCARRQDRRADRKSTRLNSSHQIISYAVFCLKKKKKKK